ncbi:MAG: sporulation protein YqfD, partial [Clostridia bacterium]
MHRRLAGRVAFRVEGLSLEKLLNLCYTQHIRLQHVDRDGLRTVSASVAYADWPVICAISEKRGWKLTVGRMSGWPTWRTWLHRRAMLAAGMGVFVAGCIFAMACVWQVEIRDAGPYIGEVRSVLAEREIHPGRFFGQLDLESLKEALQMRLTGLSWVGVERQGVRLVIRCVEGVMPGEIAQGGLPGDMVASRGGIVCDIRVIAGIARVQPGDIVRTGQVLIEGVERTSKGENKPVQARGSVRARVWLTGRATIPMRETLTLPTGASTMRRVFCTPWIAWSPTEK